MDPSLRRSLYSLMLVAATGMMVARVVNVELLVEPSLAKPRPSPLDPNVLKPQRAWPKEQPAPWPSFGSNDRSRWATVKALVENGTFAVGERVDDPTSPKGYTDRGIKEQDGFKSVDYVLHPDRQIFYSTKPPLLTLFVAAQYWVIHKVFKKDMAEEKWEVVVPILLLTNVLPLVLALWLLSRLLERFGTTDWGRLFVFAAACFGTFLPTFVTTLNNHVPAACCVLYATYAFIQSGRKPIDPQYFVEGSLGDTPNSPLRLVLAGLFAGLAVCLDLPTAAFAASLGLIVLIRKTRGLIWFAPAVVLPIALQTWITAEAIGTWEPVYAKFGGPWYEYAGSHWEKPKLWHEGRGPQPDGIDFIDEPKPRYAFHLLVGHHGFFSLTPLWLLSAVGLMFSLTREKIGGYLHHLTSLIFLAVVGFYIFKTNNYGGWTSGPRWLFWLTPLFLLALLPVADRLGRNRPGRGVAYLCLGASAFSAVYPWANPWRHPWIYQWCDYMGWVRY